MGYYEGGMGLWLRVPGCMLRVTSYWFQVAGYRFGFGFQGCEDEGCRILFVGCGFRVACCWLWLQVLLVPGYRFWVCSLTKPNIGCL